MAKITDAKSGDAGVHDQSDIGHQGRFDDGELIIGFAIVCTASGDVQKYLKKHLDGSCIRITNYWNGRSYTMRHDVTPDMTWMQRRVADRQEITPITVEEFDAAWAIATERPANPMQGLTFLSNDDNGGY